MQGFFFAFIILILSFGKAYASWDSEYWQKLNWTMVDQSCFSVQTQGELRLNRHMTTPFFYKITECFIYKMFPWLTLAANYSYLSDRPRGSKHFSWRQRIELEVDPRITLDNNITLSWMNMMMFIKEQGQSKIRYTFRHRLSVIYPVENWYNIKSVQCSEEVFYHFRNHRFTQSRFIPFQLNFEVNEDVGMAVYFMIRNFNSNNKWYRSFVLGSNLDF